MSGETLPPTATRAGVEQIDGTEYEYPYRIEDAHGQVVASGLDYIPPILTQEQVDTVASALIDALAADDVNGYHAAVLRSVLRDLPDSSHGRGTVPDAAIENSGEVWGESDE